MKNYLVLGLMIFAGFEVFGDADNCANGLKDKESCESTTYIDTKKGHLYGSSSHEKNCFFDVKHNTCCKQENITRGRMGTGAKKCR